MLVSGPGAGQDATVRLPDRRRLTIVAVAVAFGVALSGIRRWQLALLGAGFVVVGIAVLIQRRRNRAS